MNLLFALRKELKGIADQERARNLQRFFKTGKGEYGEGDVFLGITVPTLRKIARKYYNLDIKQLKVLIASKFHEERLIVLFILINKYQTTNHKKIIFHFYIKNTKNINNWDLVDLSAPKIVGEYLFARQPRISDDARHGAKVAHGIRGPAASFPPASARSIFSGKPSADSLRAVGSPSSGVTPHILLELARSENLWERRIAVLATFQFIKNNQFKDSLKIAEILLNDKHDLIHKAVGWMLREVGKRDLKTEIKFLNKYCKQMPRTMLRYAIEKFPKNLRMTYLKKN